MEMSMTEKEEWLTRCRVEIIRLAPDFTSQEASELAEVIWDNDHEGDMPSDTPEEAAASELDEWRD
jgi:hypothetical protein